ncbi:MAG TPA: hypothetical protein PLJ47_02790 [Candidatus Hydrogenedentes bacterium]|nr:hypothetical protein [Candidatus Hydrogenedentota bacterium]
MIRRTPIILLLTIVTLGCGETGEPKPKEVTITVPSIDGAMDDLKKSAEEFKDAAKQQVTESAGAEIERLYGELKEVADSFQQNAGKLEGDAKEQFEKVRGEFEDKQKEFESKLEEFKSGSGAARDELLKALYEALTDMKDALDRASKAFREGAEKSSPQPA